MNWMWDAMLVGISLFIWNVAIAISVLLAVAIVLAPGVIRRIRQQSRCSHQRYHETSACDAICSDCGKNLGFIGSWREIVAKRAS